jgi:hypothetical protein
MPYAWIDALELTDGSGLVFHSDDRLERYGYLQDPRGRTDRNQDDLPIGFVKDHKAKDGRKCDYIGMSCAACHTRELHFGGKVFHIDGAPASADFHTFLSDVGESMRVTAADDAKFAAFEARLAPDARSGECAPDLRGDLRDRGAHYALLTEPPVAHPDLKSTRWGPGRLDAVGTIVNQIFIHLEIADNNLKPVNAPADYPFIWDAHQHNQVQWNGVSTLPLVRNTVEALGVFADYGPKEKGIPLFRKYPTTIRVGGLKKLEKGVKKLRSPQWPAHLLGYPIDSVNDAASLWGEGKVLFDNFCAECHSAVPRDEGVPDIQAAMTILTNVRTAPGGAANFNDRAVADFPGIGEPLKCADPNRPPDFKPPAEQVLEKVVPGMFSTWTLATTVVPEAIRSLFLPKVDKNRCTYKGRPLDGIWATGPYLHNGSVPNLDELLKRSRDRVQSFCVSIRQSFDPEKIGLVSPPGGVTSCPPGQMLFDTTQPGNSNWGHDYGPDFSDHERKALVEYQRSL